MIVAVVITIIVVVFIGLVQNSSPDVKAKRRRTCTKHVIRSSSWGPDRKVWKYGEHRTPGNKCDGTEHEKVGWWLWQPTSRTR
jgi:hypothetical protein